MVIHRIASVFIDPCGCGVRESDGFGGTWGGQRGVRVTGLGYYEFGGKGCDLNGHIRAAADGYSNVYEGFGYRVRNEEGHMILEFAISYNFVVANSFFMKRDAI
ncbi:hypothetical protein Tco_1349513 [Tanacetum coccineum]